MILRWIVNIGEYQMVTIILHILRNSVEIYCKLMTPTDSTLQGTL